MFRFDDDQWARPGDLLTLDREGEIQGPRCFAAQPFEGYGLCLAIERDMAWQSFDRLAGLDANATGLGHGQIAPDILTFDPKEE